MASRVPEPIEKCAVCKCVTDKNVVPDRPMFVVNDGKLPPDRIVRYQRVTIQRLRKHALAQGPRFFFIHLRKARARESSLIDLHDERAEIRRIAVMMRVEETGVSFDECLSERLKTLVGAEPGEAITKKTHAGAEPLVVASAHKRVDAIGTDDEIGIAQLAEVFHHAMVDRLDADRPRPRLQQLQQLKTADG